MAEVKIDYKKEEVRDFYLKNPELISIVQKKHEQAKQLFEEGFFESSLIFSYTTIECTIRDLLIRPLFHGVIIDEEIAEMVTKEISKEKISEFDSVLINLVKTLGGVDLNKFEITKGEGFWDEIKKIRAQRNRIIHYGKDCSAEEAQKALSVAEIFLVKIFGDVLRQLGF